MTIEQQNEDEQYLSIRFAVTPEQFERQGRSLSLLLLHRRCATCWGTLIQETAGDLEIPADEHMEQIVNHCSQTPDFIYSGLPIMEAAFRILVSNGTNSLSLEDIYNALQEKWSDASSHWTPLPAKLYRMLAKDTFYGISEVTNTSA